MKVAVVIVNFKSADLAVECLRSLEPELARYPGSRAVVVENASADGSTQRLVTAVETENWHAWVRLMPLRINAGYAAGNNAGIRMLLSSARAAGIHPAVESRYALAGGGGGGADRVHGEEPGSGNCGEPAGEY